MLLQPSVLSSNLPLNTVTVKLQLEALFDASVAVQVTEVTPMGKQLPEGGLQTTVTAQLSETVGAKVTFAQVSLTLFVTAVMFAGQVKLGACVSVTVMVNEQESEVPSSLVPVTVTVVVPTGKNDPEGGLLVTVPQFPLKVGVG